MFAGARLKLTTWYLLIIMLISVSFSSVIYKVLTQEIERFERMQRLRIERRLQEGEFFGREERFRRLPLSIMTNPELLEETRRRILLILIAINSGIFATSAVLGYVLAGRTLKPIAEMMDEQNRFISDASHELKTPLTSLKSAFEVFQRNEKPTLQEAKTLVGESINEVNKLQSLSDSLLQLAQYQRPNGSTRFEKLLLPQIIEEAIHRIEPVAKKKKISIEKDLKDLTIEGDKYSLIDLVVILLDNAVKYSHKESKVNVTTEKTDGFALILIKDCGPGIDKKDLPHIFDRFFRTDSARLRESTGGYGLGLSIAKKIVDTHKGSIQVKSELQKGSIFTVKLPINQSSRVKKLSFFS